MNIVLVKSSIISTLPLFSPVYTVNKLVVDYVIGFFLLSIPQNTN